MITSLKCCICGAETKDALTASINSNVRHYASEVFPVWRCPSCQTIHADREVNLDDYYEYYPFFGKKLDWAMRAGYHGLLRRLRKSGLKKSSSILDYGCGSGLLVEYLKDCGYDAVGYDPYATPFDDRSVLDRQYDCIIGQDVLEHVVDPPALLDSFDSLVVGGGLIAIGTPNASGIDLDRPGKYIHPLHQPYHRHILSIGAIRDAATARSWEMVKYYSTPYTNMVILSLPFMHHYMRSNDGTLDVLFERSCSRLFWFNPKTWFVFIFGWFFCDDADIFAVFRKRQSSG